MVLKTVNVIETDENGLVTSLRSFSDEPEGNDKAESLFRKIAAETTDLTGEEIEQRLGDGFLPIPGCAYSSLQIVHSA